MKGILLPDNNRLNVRLAPIFSDLESLWWYVDCQQYPLHPRLDGVEQLHDSYWYDCKACQNTSAHVWRPGAIAALSPYMFLDEWSYLVGFESIEQDVEGKAIGLMNSMGTEPTFFNAKSLYSIFIVEVDDNWFEVYSSHETWLEKLAQCHSHAQWIKSEKWDKWYRDQAIEIEKLKRGL